MAETSQASSEALRDHHVIESLKITAGFLGGTTLHFVDGLNCLIGGRGAGKTTALELVRFGLGLMPDQKNEAQRFKAIDSLIKANLGAGRVAVALRTRTGMQYTAGRGVDQSVQVLNESGTPVPILLDRDQVFGADVFSQNQIEEIALNPRAQLELLDRFRELETLAVARELEQLRRSLQESGEDLFSLDREIEDLAGKASEVAVLEEKLKGLAFVGGPDAEKVNSAHKARSQRTKETQALQGGVQSIEKATREVTTVVADFAAEVEARVDSSLIDGPNGTFVAELKGELSAFTTALDEVSNRLRMTAGQATLRLTQLSERLATAQAVQEAEYRALVSQSEEEGGRALERSTAQGLLEGAQAAAAEMASRIARRELLRRDRTELLKRDSELRDRRFSLRKATADRLSTTLGTIRVTVSQAADTQSYREYLADVLKGAGVRQGQTAERIAQVYLPAELSQLVIADNHKTLMDGLAFDEDKVRKIVAALRRDGVVYALELAVIEDHPRIELLDGMTYKQSQHLSTGQRCTTILPILLIQSERPLLVDQPEDNLDNAFVYETVVKALKAVRGTRQVIFVTHNPNIPVLGDAERVFVFESDGQHGTLTQSGTVDECREHIERILEGGRQAFLDRKRRYGH